MTAPPLQPVAIREPAARAVLMREFVFVSGKGGTGKTTVAAALGRGGGNRAACAGLRSHRLRPACGHVRGQRAAPPPPPRLRHVENYDIAAAINADGSAPAVGSNARMRSRQAYGAHRALRQVAGVLARLAGPLKPVAPLASPARDGAAATCAMCHGDHLCPMEWGAMDEHQWWVLSRCGDCGVWAEVVLSNAQAATLDVALDRQMAQIRAAAARLDAERMTDAADAFAAALQRDLIVAADF